MSSILTLVMTGNIVEAKSRSSNCLLLALAWKPANPGASTNCNPEIQGLGYQQIRAEGGGLIWNILWLQYFQCHSLRVLARSVRFFIWKSGGPPGLDFQTSFRPLYLRHSGHVMSCPPSISWARALDGWAPAILILLAAYGGWFTYNAAVSL